MAFIGNQPTAVPLTSSQLADGLITSAKIADGAVVNVDVNSTAAIAYSKLNLATSIVNGDIANATIALAKLSATGTPSASTFLRGDNSWASAGATAGQVIQVVSTAKTDTFSLSTGSTYTDITGLSVTITPSSASNKILVMYKVSIGTNAGNGFGYTKLLRGATDIFIGDSSGNKVQATQGGCSVGSQVTYFNGASFLDSPNTTSATTYKIQAYAQAGTGIIYVNRTYDDGDSTVSSRDASSITVMEIKG